MSTKRYELRSELVFAVNDLLVLLSFSLLQTLIKEFSFAFGEIEITPGTYHYSAVNYDAVH